MKRILLFFTAAIVSALMSHADETPKAITFHLKAAQYADSLDKAPEFVFVIGELAYRSFEDLKRGVSRLPKGSSLQWVQSCPAPPAFTDKQLSELKTLCDSVGIKFIHRGAG